MAVYVIIGFASISIPCSITNRVLKSLTGDENLVNLTRHPSHKMKVPSTASMPHTKHYAPYADILTGQKFYHFTSRSFNAFAFLLFLFLQAIQPNQSEITSATSSPAPEEKSAEDAGRAAYSTAMAVAWLKAFWGILPNPLKLWLMMVNGI